MKSPFTGKEMSIRREKRMLNFRKEEIEIDFHYYYCEDTGEKFESDDLAELNRLQVLNKYRERLNLPFPEKIIEIRKKYGIPASTMSDILGFGVNTYRNYENGEIPSTANARLMQMIEHSGEFAKMVDLSKNLLQKEREKILRRISQLNENTRKPNPIAGDWLLSTGNPNEFNGYRQFDFEKAARIAVYFAEKMQLWKTTLNKLLFYCDFYHFKENCYSISGLNYRAIQLGPVPANFDTLFDQIVVNNHLSVEYNEFPNGALGERYIPGQNITFNPEFFNDSEIKTMVMVHEKFKNMTAQQIIELSHIEKAWKENQKEKKIISYYYAFEMEND